MKKILILFLILAAGSQVNAQYISARLNLPSLILRNLSVSGEFGITENTSFNMGASFMFPMRNVTVDQGFGEFRTANGGFSLTPELRFYLGGSKYEGAGFYLAPYLRYANYQAGFTGTYYDSTLGIDSDVETTTSLTEFGGGLQVGYQLLIEDHFVIDFMIFGPRLSRYVLNARVESDLVEDELFDALGIPKIDQNGFYGIGSYDITYGSDFVNLRFPLTFAALRFGLSVGYRF